MWLGAERGELVDWTTQKWVQATGRRIDLDRDDWIAGPVGFSSGIGKDFFPQLAQQDGLEVRRRDSPIGLIPSFDALAGPTFNPAAVNSDVRRFYEQTSEYSIDSWAEWCSFYRPFGGLLALLFSRRLQQLNVPLSGLDTSRGMTSELYQLVNPRSDTVLYTAWVRELVGTGNVIYVGGYMLCRAPGYEGVCIKVAFPLPNGYALVVMRPEVRPDGTFVAHSSGQRFGDPGFYFVVRRRDGRTWARYVKSMRESIHVYPAADGEVRTDHVLRLWGPTFLRLHYRLQPKT